MAKIPMSRVLYDALLKPYRDAGDLESHPEGRGVSLMMLREFVERGKENYAQRPECDRWLIDSLSRLDLKEEGKLTQHKFFNAFGLRDVKESKTAKRHKAIRLKHYLGASLIELEIKHSTAPRTLHRILTGK